MITPKERFTLTCRTNHPSKMREFKPIDVSKNDYILWLADSNLMLEDAIKANDIGISYQRQLELIHGSIERILKSFIIKEYGLLPPVHEISTIYETLKNDFEEKLNLEESFILEILDAKFLLDRYPSNNRFYTDEMLENSMKTLIHIKALVNSKLLLGNNAKTKLDSFEEKWSIPKKI